MASVVGKAIEMYVLLSCLLKTSKIPYRVRGQILSAGSSVHANIAEGNCRRSLKEYKNFVNYALGSLGELWSLVFGCFKAGQIGQDDFCRFETVHYEVENKAIRLLAALQRRHLSGTWTETL